MSGRSDDDLLCGFLAIAVMAAVDDLRWTDETIRLRMIRDLGYPDIKAKREFGDPADYHAQFTRLDALPEGGHPLGTADDVMFGGRGIAKGFAAVAKVVALLAYGYGGVTFGPLHWCAAHMHQKWTQADGQVCPSCLREEEARLSASEGEQHAA